MCKAMPVYLSLGKDKIGQFHHIESVRSGRVNLYCPFCGCDLIAVKGKLKAHHFRHEGETCSESLNEIPPIPAWHHFHLNYPLDVVQALQEGYQPDSKRPDVFHPRHLRKSPFPHRFKNELFALDEWSGNYLYTNTAKVILGSLSVPAFNEWMRQSLKDRISELQRAVAAGEKHKAWFEIEANRQQIILNSTLYLFEYQLEDGRLIHKVGRTTRELMVRLNETVSDLEQATGKAVSRKSVVRSVGYAGHNEKYVLHRYKNQQWKVGSLTEYLVLDAKATKRLKAEFTKLSNNSEPFDLDERFIVTGRWRYEEKRLAASKRGIALTLRENGQFGRPKGSTLSREEFLSKHDDIVALLKSGLSINEVVKRTLKSRSTVKRIKAEMK